MIKDDIMKMTVYESPPENKDLADQRMQLLYARELIPQSHDDAKSRVKMAGPYPSNLTDVVFQNVDQFLGCLRDMHDGICTYKADAVIVLNGGPRKTVYAGQAYTNDNRFIFVLEQMPHKMRVVLARSMEAPEKYEQWLTDLRNILGDGAGEL